MSRAREPIAPLDPQPIRLAVKPLLDWYHMHARKLPWRETKDPYRIWLSEIMLQQTRVEAVIPYYHRFLAELPDIRSLAAVSDERLMKLWEGLGYYSRARNLKKAAQLCVERYGGTLPSTYDELLNLPGFGMYTAGAVASIAFGQPVPAVDGNVLRVITRLCRYGEDIMLPAVRKEFFSVLSGWMPEESGAFNQSLMDLGATICLPNGTPNCKGCPLNMICTAHLEEQETAFPLKRAKNARRIEEKTVFLMECEDHFLLHRRGENGLLASMWEFCNTDGYVTAQEAKALCSTLGLSVCDVEESVSAKHIFSHVEWHMRGMRVRVLDMPKLEDYIWVNRKQLEREIALPSAFAAFKKEIGGNK